MLLRESDSNLKILLGLPCGFLIAVEGYKTNPLKKVTVESAYSATNRQ